jgi:hypothetical protein
MSDLFFRISDPKLSLWQSVVAEHVKDNHFANAETTASKMDVLQHEMVIATNVFVKNRFNNLPEKLTDAARLSELAYEIGLAKIENREADEKALMEEARKFTDHDTNFLYCATTFAQYCRQYGKSFKYNDWTKQGKGTNYGVIDYKIPNGAKVGIIGDWGTGLPDAYALLFDMVANKNVDVIIHLGDIYYSGTPYECENNYAKLFRKVFQETGRRLPVFTIPGNHDYYSLGWGYYEIITRMNDGIPGATQPASYFCLRTEDNGWQFLGMDTGRDDSSPFNQFNPFLTGPSLVNSELLWHIHKMDTFDGATILLSHHQVFSANASINGKQTVYPGYLNFPLLLSFRQFFSSKVAAWLWGHEHNFVLYKDNIFGLAKGRLIGASAYEELIGSDPYKVNYAMIPYLDPEKYRVGSAMGYYNHNYAVIDLSVRKTPMDPVHITYYDFPSWGTVTAHNVQSTSIYSEYLSKPSGKREPVCNNSKVQLKMGSGVQFFGPLQKYLYGSNFPKLSGTVAVELILDNGKAPGTPLKDGDFVTIRTTEENAGDHSYLEVMPGDLIYYNKRNPDAMIQQWYISKDNPSGDYKTIHFGDAISLLNQGHRPGFISPPMPAHPDYLTTNEKVYKTYFVIDKIISY